MQHPDELSQNDAANERTDPWRRIAELEAHLASTEAAAAELRAARDEAERRAQEHASRVVELQQREASRKDRFLSTMSHEIRTPMNGVIGCIELLRQAGVEGESQLLLETLEQSSESLMTMLTDLLDFAKLESGSTRLRSEAFDLRDVVDDIARIARAAAAQKALSLECHVSGELPEQFVGDPGRVAKVLGHLTRNALKFTEEGSVTISAERGEQPNTVQFSVQDTGVGVSASAKERIFNALTQGDDSTARAYGGTGIGLALSRSLVAAMGGVLQVHGEPGSGSTFEFSIPLPESSNQERAKPRLMLPPTLDRAPSEPTRPMRVLVVDDNAVNRLVAEKMLKRLGCETGVATGGEEAVQLASEPGADWDLVLMDCAMPGVDGFEATRRIRALGGAPGDVRILALTAFALEGDRERCLDSGMDEYLTKPLRMDELKDALSVAQAAR